MSSTGASTTTSQSLPNTPNLISIFITVAGVFATTIGMLIQFFVINNGPSGDNMIMGNIRTYGAVIGTSILCLFVGLLMWKLLNQTSKSFLWLFIITWISYLLANMAIMFSLFQVELKNQ